MTLNDSTDLLDELVSLTRFMARDSLERALRTALRDEKHRIAFELTDGSRTQTEVARQADLSQPAMSDLWKKWRRMGLVRDGKQGMRHLVALADLGWETPATPSPRSRIGGPRSGKDHE